MQVLVTGGAGFIGSHLVDALLAGGHQVRVLDNLSTGSRENLAQHAASQDMQLIEGSVTDAAAVGRAVEGCSMVYHLAAAIGVRYVVDDPLAGIATNVRGTEEVLAAAANVRARVVLASSSEVYGKAISGGPWRPFQEDQDSVVGPTTVTRWWYALAKGLDEHLGFAYHRQKGLAVSAVRYFNVYGPRCRPGGYGVIARFVTQALRGEPLSIFGDGTQSRSFTYVSDAVRATLLTGTRTEAIGEVFNVGSETEMSIADAAQLVLRLTGSNSTMVYADAQTVYGPHFEDTHRRVPNVSKADRLLGFRAAVDCADGITRTAQWWAGPPRRL